MYLEIFALFIWPPILLLVALGVFTWGCVKKQKPKPQPSPMPKAPKAPNPGDKTVHFSIQGPMNDSDLRIPQTQTKEEVSPKLKPNPPPPPPPLPPPAPEPKPAAAPTPEPLLKPAETQISTPDRKTADKNNQESPRKAKKKKRRDDTADIPDGGDEEGMDIELNPRTELTQDQQTVEGATVGTPQKRRGRRRRDSNNVTQQTQEEAQ